MVFQGDDCLNTITAGLCVRVLEKTETQTRKHTTTRERGFFFHYFCPLTDPVNREYHGEQERCERDDGNEWHPSLFLVCVIEPTCVDAAKETQKSAHAHADTPSESP
jgi:hypothetical protein